MTKSYRALNIYICNKFSAEAIERLHFGIFTVSLCCLCSDRICKIRLGRCFCEYFVGICTVIRGYGIRAFTRTEIQERAVFHITRSVVTDNIYVSQALIIFIRKNIRCVKRTAISCAEVELSHITQEYDCKRIVLCTAFVECTVTDRKCCKLATEYDGRVKAGTFIKAYTACCSFKERRKIFRHKINRFLFRLSKCLCGIKVTVSINNLKSSVYKIHICTV